MTDIPKITRTAGRVQMPAGEYYVGDPCYTVPYDRWVEWLEAAGYRDEDRILLAPLDGHPVLGISTQYGDGSYEDQHGADYLVDSGLIGLVPVEVAGEDDGLSYKIKFERPFTCSLDGRGRITIGHLRIETGS